MLCVTSNFPRWAGDSTTPFVLNLTEDLQAQGWAIDVLAPHAPGAAREETINGVHVERFRYLLPEAKQTVCYQGGALVNLRKNPREKLKLPMLVAAELAAITNRLRSRDYDILNSHWILPQGFTGMLATKVVAVPHVITVHGGDIFSLKGKLLSRMKRAALHSASAVTVNSSFTLSRTEQVAPKIRRLERIPMGVNASPPSEKEIGQAETLRKQYKNTGGPLLVFVGRLVEEKGAQDAIAAVELLRDQLPNTKLLVIGEGQDRLTLEQQTIQLGLQNNVQFLGWIDPAHVRAYMAAADIFLGPSRTTRDGWVEAQGLTFIEAMAVGTPVIATRVGGIMETVRHKETGLLVDEKSPQQIADAIVNVTNDPGMEEHFRKQTGIMLDAEYSRKSSATSFNRLFESLIQNKHVFN